MTAKHIVGGVVAGLVVTGAVVGTGEAMREPSATPDVPWTTSAPEPTTEAAPEPTVEPDDHWTEATPEPTPALDWDDQAYILTLDAGGIQYSSPEAAITAGHAICDSLDAGLDFDAITDAAMQGGGYSAYDAGYIYGAATAVYCPEHL